MHYFNCPNLVESERMLLKMFHPIIQSYHGLMWCYNHIKCDHDDMIISLTVIYVNCCTYVTQSLVFLQWDNLISVVKHSSIILLMWSCQCDEIDMMIWSNCQVIHWVAPPAPLNRDMITSNLMIRSFHPMELNATLRRSYHIVMWSFHDILYYTI